MFDLINTEKNEVISAKEYKATAAKLGQWFSVDGKEVHKVFQFLLPNWNPVAASDPTSTSPVGMDKKLFRQLVRGRIDLDAQSSRDFNE